MVRVCLNVHVGVAPLMIVSVWSMAVVLRQLLE